MTNCSLANRRNRHKYRMNIEKETKRRKTWVSDIQLIGQTDSHLDLLFLFHRNLETESDRDRQTERQTEDLADNNK